MLPEHVLQVIRLSQNMQKFLSVTQIPRDLLNNQFSNWKDGKQ